MILDSFTGMELPKFSYPQPFWKGLVIVQSPLYLCQTGIWYIHLSKCIIGGAYFPAFRHVLQDIVDHSGCQVFLDICRCVIQCPFANLAPIDWLLASDMF